MDWNKGFSAEYYISVVDRATWRDMRRIEITGGSIKRSLTGLRESADINCVGYSEANEELIRVWLDTQQDGSSSHTPLFTGLASSPGRNINGKLETNTLQCYSVLKMAEDILLQRGWYAPKDAIGANLVENLLKPIGAPMNIAANSPTLTNAIISEDGETLLSMADKILDAITWRLYLDGRGEIHIGPINKEPVAVFDSLDNDILEPQLNVTYDWYGCPNVMMVVSGDASAVVRDDDPNSPFSTVNRKREIWAYESTSYLNNEETLAQYAKRRLLENQRVNTEISYNRRFRPNIIASDVITLNYPEQRISGNFVIESQTISLTHGATLSEEVIKI